MEKEGEKRVSTVIAQKAELFDIVEWVIDKRKSILIHDDTKRIGQEAYIITTEEGEPSIH